MNDSKAITEEVSIESPSGPDVAKRPKAGGKPGRSGPPGNQNSQKHGLTLLKEKVRKIGTRAIDGRTKLALTLRNLRDAITADLGGKERLSQAQQILIDDVARLTLWIDSVDGWLLTLDTIVIKRKRTLIPVVKERTALVETRARLLQALGLERRTKQALTLGDIAAEYATKDNGHSESTAVTRKTPETRKPDSVESTGVTEETKETTKPDESPS